MNKSTKRKEKQIRERVAILLSDIILNMITFDVILKKVHNFHINSDPFLMLSFHLNYWNIK